jgi:hypothetical protein
MAEQLIYLDVGDGIAEIIARLKSAKQERVVLVIPKRAVIVHSPINLKVIKLEADRLGLILTVITQDEIAKNFANQVGLTVVDQLDSTPPMPSDESLTPKTFSYQDTEVKSDTESPLISQATSTDVPIVKYKTLSPTSLDEDLALEVPSAIAKGGRKMVFTLDWSKLQNFRLKRHHKVLLGFTFVGVILISVVSFFVVPKAYVDIEVQSEAFAKQFTITLADETDLRAAGPNVLTGRFIEVSREDVTTFPATGEENRGEKSSGQIRIVNHTNIIQGIIKNTRFESPSGLIFKINEEVLVPPARSGNPGTAVVSAISDGGGANNNVSAPMKLTIPGLGENAVDSVYGEVVGAFSGATDDIIKIVSEEDLNKAKEEASKNIFVAAETEIKAQLKRNEDVWPVLIQNDIIDAVPSATAGAKRDDFEIRVQSRSWVIILNREDIDEAITNAAVFEVPEGKQVTGQTVKDANVEVLESNFLTREIQLLIKMDGRVGPQINIDALRTSLANKSVSDGVEFLQSDPAVTTGSIEISPTFLTRIPMLLNNIRIQVIYLGE